MNDETYETLLEPLTISLNDYAILVHIPPTTYRIPIYFSRA